MPRTGRSLPVATDEVKKCPDINLESNSPAAPRSARIRFAPFPELSRGVHRLCDDARCLLAVFVGHWSAASLHGRMVELTLRTPGLRVEVICSLKPILALPKAALHASVRGRTSFEIFTHSLPRPKTDPEPPEGSSSVLPWSRNSARGVAPCQPLDRTLSSRSYRCGLPARAARSTGSRRSGS